MGVERGRSRRRGVGFGGRWIETKNSDLQKECAI